MPSSDTLRENGLIREGPEPLYGQIARLLAAEIKSGKLNDRLMAEPDLGRRFGVSRVTVRLAVDILVKERLVVRRQGKGTYVSSPLRHDLGSSQGFFDTLFAQGHRPATRLRVCSAVSPPAEVAEMLRLTAGQPALHFERLYMIESKTIGIASGWLTPDALSVPREQLEANSTGVILRQVLGLSIARADLRIRSARAGRAIARALGISANAPVLTQARDCYLADGRAVEIASMTIRAEAFEFRLTTGGSGNTQLGLQSITEESTLQ